MPFSLKQLQQTNNDLKSCTKIKEINYVFYMSYDTGLFIFLQYSDNICFPL